VCVLPMILSLTDGPLSLSLSPLEGARVPFRAGEGRWVAAPGFQGLGCLKLLRFSPPRQEPQQIREPVQVGHDLRVVELAGVL